MCLPGTVETVRRRADEEGLRFDRRTALLARAGAALAGVLPVLRPEVDVLGAHGNAHGRPGALRRERAHFQNVGADGLQHFPGFGKPAVDWLLAEREIMGIGVDTASLGHGRSTTFATHLTILGANRYGIENLANLAKIPPRGATLYVGLIPWEEGSGGPARVLARW